MAAEQNKRDHHFKTHHHHHHHHPQVVVSSRWNPTPEQLQTLEELYRRGTRTPSAEQIQHITAQLRRYGKIEGKNVFYWFQNHKARERQKRRRQLESSPASDNHHNNENPRSHCASDHLPPRERKESKDGNRTGFEVEQTKNWATPTNCTTTFLEKSHVSPSSLIQRAAAAKAECRAEAEDNYDDVAGVGLQQRRSHWMMERNDTWQQMVHPTNNLIMNMPTNTTTATTTTTSSTIVEKNLIIDKLLPYHHRYRDGRLVSAPFRETDQDREYGQEGGEVVTGYEESQTLQLFPLTSGDGYEEENGNEEDGERETRVSTCSSSSMDATVVTPYQFFEFLPLKNN